MCIRDSHGGVAFPLHHEEAADDLPVCRGQDRTYVGTSSRGFSHVGQGVYSRFVRKLGVYLIAGKDIASRAPIARKREWGVRRQADLARGLAILREVADGRCV